MKTESDIKRRDVGRKKWWVVSFFVSLAVLDASEQPFPSSLEIEKLNKALVSIDLLELNRQESLLKQCLEQGGAQGRSLCHFYLGQIYLRTALYYETKGDAPSLLNTCEYLFDQARVQFKKAVRENKNFSDGYAYLAMAYAQKIKYVGYPRLLKYAKRVEEYTKEALQKNPRNPWAYLVQGIQMMYKPVSHGGGVDKAIPLLQKTLEIDPSFSEGYYWLARAYMQNSFKERDEKKAQEYLSRALELSPGDYFYRRGFDVDVQIPIYREDELKKRGEK